MQRPRHIISARLQQTGCPCGPARLCCPGRPRLHRPGEAGQGPGVPAVPAPAHTESPGSGSFRAWAAPRIRQAAPPQEMTAGQAASVVLFRRTHLHHDARRLPDGGRYDLLHDAGIDKARGRGPPRTLTHPHTRFSHSSSRLSVQAVCLLSGIVSPPASGVLCHPLSGIRCHRNMLTAYPACCARMPSACRRHGRRWLSARCARSDIHDRISASIPVITE